MGKLFVFKAMTTLIGNRRYLSSKGNKKRSPSMGWVLCPGPAVLAEVWLLPSWWHHDGHKDPPGDDGDEAGATALE